MSEVGYLGQAIQPKADGAWQGCAGIAGFYCAYVDCVFSELFPPSHGTHLQRNGSPEHSYVGMQKTTYIASVLFSFSNILAIAQQCPDNSLALQQQVL